MRNSAINRFEWQKAVLQQQALTPATRLVAAALATQFANDETGQLNPSMETLAAFLGVSLASVKRAIRALVDAGWLHRTEGRGRGNVTSYTLVSPGKIIRFRSPKKEQSAPKEKGAEVSHYPAQKGSDASLYQREKGSKCSQKGVTSEPSYIEQSKEQKDARLRAYSDVQFAGSPHPGLCLVDAKAHSLALTDWDRWLAENGLPKLFTFPLRAISEKGNTYWRLPWHQPPKTPEQTSQALRFFSDMLAHEDHRYAAQ